MALRVLRDGLRLEPGSGRLILLRLLAHLGASLPLLLTALVTAASAARAPYFTDVAGPLPAAHLARLPGALGGAALGAATLLAALLFLLAEQVITAGALVWLDPRRGRDGRGPVAVVAREGLAQLWIFLRIAAFSLLALAAGGYAIRAGFASLEVRGDVAGWSGRTLVLLLPALQLLALALWAAVVGAWALCCRTLSVIDERRRVRRTALIALGVLRRHPGRALGYLVGVALCTALAGGGVLFLWRQQAPSGALLAAWAAAWLAVLGLQAWAWHWRLRAMLLLCARSEPVAALRQTPDDPLRPLAWIGPLLDRIWPRR